MTSRQHDGSSAGGQTFGLKRPVQTDGAVVPVLPELLTMPATGGTGTFITELRQAQASVPLLVDLRQAPPLSTEDTTHLVVAIRETAADGRPQLAVIVTDRRLHDVFSWTRLPNVIVCRSLAESRAAIAGRPRA